MKKIDVATSPCLHLCSPRRLRVNGNGIALVSLAHNVGPHLRSSGNRIIFSRNRNVATPNVLCVENLKCCFVSNPMFLSACPIVEVLQSPKTVGSLFVFIFPKHVPFKIPVTLHLDSLEFVTLVKASFFLPWCIFVARTNEANGDRA